MKKYLLLVLAVALMAGVTSCNKKGGSRIDADGSAKTTATEDSLSYYFGQIVAAQQIGMETGGDPTRPAQLCDKAAFMKGLEQALKTDTTLKATSYAQGYQVGVQLASIIKQAESQGVKFNKKLLLAEFKKTYLANQDPKRPMDPQMIYQAASAKMQVFAEKAQQEGMAKKAAEMKKKCADAMAKEEKTGEYKKTKSGILYKVLKAGKGETFKQGQTVTVKYTGSHLLSKQVFDQNTAEFPVDEKQMIPGFVEVLKMMNPGEKIKVILPSDLAYGDKGEQSQMTGEMFIEGGEALMFEIEAVGVAPEKKQEAPQAPQKPAQVKK